MGERLGHGLYPDTGAADAQELGLQVGHGQGIQLGQAVLLDLGEGGGGEREIGRRTSRGLRLAKLTVLPGLPSA